MSRKYQQRDVKRFPDTFLHAVCAAFSALYGCCGMPFGALFPAFCSLNCCFHSMKSGSWHPHSLLFVLSFVASCGLIGSFSHSDWLLLGRTETVGRMADACIALSVSVLLIFSKFTRKTDEERGGENGRRYSVILSDIKGQGRVSD